MLFLSIISNGVFIEFFVFIKNIAGKPSGPAAEFMFNFPIAFTISSSLISMSAKSPSCTSLNNSLVTFVILAPLLN